MDSILREIKKLRSDTAFTIEDHSNCRYSITFNEYDQSKTTYYFSVPIYRVNSQKILDLNFHYDQSICRYYGSNTTIEFGNSIVFRNQYGSCKIILTAKIKRRTERELSFSTQTENIKISPTLNGLLIKVYYDKDQIPIIKLVSDLPRESKSNNKFFSLMAKQFTPLITISCIGVFDHNNKLIAPCDIHSVRESNCISSHSFHPCSNTGSYLMFEINMHESKLFQDTTVESKHPTINNVYGGMAYLGKTSFYGEQWLYSRLEYSFLEKAYNQKIQRAILHLPNVNHSKNELALYQAATRFCSFESNWDNKKEMIEPAIVSSTTSEYYHINIKNLIKAFPTSINFVIKASYSSNPPPIISTGDSYQYPQILELNYR